MMSDSMDDDSLPAESGCVSKRQETGWSSSSKDKKGNDSSPPTRFSPPKITYTGSSSHQPLTLDGSEGDSDSDDELEVLPPQKKKQSGNSNNNNNGSSSVNDNSNDNDKLTTKRKFATASVAGGGGGGESDSDSDSDDSLLRSPGIKTLKTKSNNSTTRHTALLATDSNKAGAAGAAAAQTKQQKRAADQERKKAERQAAQALKRQQKQAELEARKRQRLEQQAARGNFATQEIVLLVDPPLFSANYNWKEHDEMIQHQYRVQEYRSALGGSSCQALQWIRQEHLKGGATEAWKQLRQNSSLGYTHLDRLVIVMDDPKVFLRLLHRTGHNDDDDDYPLLREWLLKLQHGWNAAWPQSKAANQSPKIMILLYKTMQELDRQWIDFRKTHRNNQSHHLANSPWSPPSAEEFHDALTWMLIQYQVESMCCDSYEEIWTAAFKMTRALAKAPYQQPITEADIKKRIKPAVENASSNNNNNNHLEVAQDAWLRQLQMIPSVSETKARNLMQHYPTLQSLHQAYQQPKPYDTDSDANNNNNNNNKALMLAGCLSDRSNQAKLSQSIYKLFTSTNPEEMI